MTELSYQMQRTFLENVTSTHQVMLRVWIPRAEQYAAIWLPAGVETDPPALAAIVSMFDEWIEAQLGYVDPEREFQIFDFRRQAGRSQDEAPGMTIDELVPGITDALEEWHRTRAEISK